MIVVGRAGTGNSQVINTIVNRRPAGVVKVAAMSGVAAHNIGGTTLHALLRLPIHAPLTQLIPNLPVDAKRRLQREFENVRYLIIDEMSFVGQRTLARIDSRMREVRPVMQGVPFGHRSEERRLGKEWCGT